jgi:hypothetical protein
MKPVCWSNDVNLYSSLPHHVQQFQAKELTHREWLLVDREQHTLQMWKHDGARSNGGQYVRSRGRN